MPLEIYDRGGKYWVRGHVEYDGRRVTGYLRESTGTFTEAGARAWAAERTTRERRRHLLGEEGVFTFADAVMLYPVKSASDAARLAPLVERLGALPVRDIAPKTVRDIAVELYPTACTDTWRRAVVTPVRAVINNAHDLGKCPPIKIRGFGEDERLAQDLARQRPSRVERVPGSWEWLLRFRAHAGRYHAALAHFMFVTGARIGQAVAMHPGKHLDLQNARVCVPGAKGSGDRWLTVSMDLVVELANLPAKCPRGYPRKKANLRVFGFATRQSPLSGWETAIRRAGIARIMPHAAGRHGFGQEMNVRQRVDEKAAAKFGGWRDTVLMRKTYTHAEDVDGKIQDALSTGQVQAELTTGLKLLSRNGKL